MYGKCYYKVSIIYDWKCGSVTVWNTHSQYNFVARCLSKIEINPEKVM